MFHTSKVQKKLMVRIGSTLQDLQLVNPNDEENPIVIKNNHFNGFCLIRIKNFKGLIPKDLKPIGGEEYFVGKKHRFSLMIQGNFKQETNASDVVWDVQWEKPLNVPNMFIKFWNLVAPHSMADLGGQHPYVKSFIITASSVFQSYTEKLTGFRKDVREDISSILPNHLEIKKKSFFYSEESTMVQSRRKLFTVPENRDNVVFKPNCTISFETYNNFFDPNTFRVNVMGTHLDVNYLLNDQPLRLFLRSKDGSLEFLVVELSLGESETLLSTLSTLEVGASRSGSSPGSHGPSGMLPTLED
jgi:hypothetical protein